MAGFASGIIDSFLHVGASIALKLLGWLPDKNWDYGFCFMAPFGIIGGLLLFFIRNRNISSNRPPDSGRLEGHA